MTTPVRERLGRWLFAVSLRAFPRRFRKRHTDGLLLAFDHQAADARRSGTVGWLVFLVASISDVVTGGVAERVSDLSRGPTAVAEGFRRGLRGIRRGPGFALAVVLTFGLGLGANTTMYGIADRLLLRPPEHIRDADSVFHIYLHRLSPFSHAPEVTAVFSYPDFADLETLDALAGVAGFGGSTRTLGSGRDAERVHVQLATASYFSVLGVQPALGRFFSESEDRVEGSALVAVLSHGFWVRRFGGDPGVIGRDLRIGPGRYRVVGVAPEGFTGATIEPVDLWAPLRSTQAAEYGDGWVNARGWQWLRVVARLAEGGDPAAAAARATAAHRTGRNASIRAQRYDANARVELYSLVPGSEPDARSEIAVSRWLVGVALFVLFIACANVANLLLLRAVRQRRELAIRVALGISRKQLFVSLLVETLFLSLLGGVAAVAAARWGGDIIYRTLLPGLDPGQVSRGPRLLVFALVAALGTALLAGGVPALLAARLTDVIGDLRNGSRGSPRVGRFRTVLVVVQVSLSVVLLSGAGVFLLSLVRAGRLDLGFDPHDVLVVRAETAEGFFNEESERALLQGRERLRGIHGVDAVAAVSLPPFSGLNGVPLIRENGDTVPGRPGPFYYTATPNYFRAMGMHVTRGRSLEEGDLGVGAAPVVVLSEGLARRAFGVAEDPLDRCLYVGAGPGEAPCSRVVGILADHRSSALVEDESPIFYVPPGHPAAIPLQALVVRVAGREPSAFLSSIQNAVFQSGSSVRYVSVSPLMNGVDARTRSWKLGATLFAVFGILALLVAALGLYSVIAFEVAQRRWEIGIRVALGARGSAMVWMVFRQALMRTAVGVALGMAGVLALVDPARDLLFRTSPSDPLVLFVVALTLVLVAAVASLRPAASASRVSPTEALRSM